MSQSTLDTFHPSHLRNRYWRAVKRQPSLDRLIQRRVAQHKANVQAMHRVANAPITISDDMLAELRRRLGKGQVTDEERLLLAIFGPEAPANREG